MGVSVAKVDYRQHDRQMYICRTTIWIGCGVPTLSAAHAVGAGLESISGSSGGRALVIPVHIISTRLLLLLKLFRENLRSRESTSGKSHLHFDVAAVDSDETSLNAAHTFFKGCDLA